MTTGAYLNRFLSCQCVIGQGCHCIKCWVWSKCKLTKDVISGNLSWPFLPRRPIHFSFTLHAWAFSLPRYPFWLNTGIYPLFSITSPPQVVSSQYLILFLTNFDKIKMSLIPPLFVFDQILPLQAFALLDCLPLVLSSQLRSPTSIFSATFLI